MKTISICVPCYNEEKNVIPAYMAIKKIIKKNKKYQFELIFVDNGSLDKTRNIITKIARKDKNIKGVYLSRNFGPEASGFAGINYSRGDAFIGISCDLQDPPELITKFIKKWEEGYDLVLGVYERHDENLLMKSVRESFYKFFNRISNTKIPANAVGFGLYDKKVIEGLKSLPEKYRFTKGLLAWLGFKKSFIKYTRRKRLRGKSSYNFYGYIKDAERGIFGFSYLPLDLMVYSGFVLTIFSFLFVTGYLYTVLVFGNPINASIPIMLGMFFFGGVQLLALSIVGKYIQVIVEETKNRPIYIVEETINIQETKRLRD